ncbi:alpha/beta fold hydrolase [Trichloromonas sp.]|uniref:alpha/beta fold hydrolase n=1 Tax=Trichloromonas sp. TaxID=3069249 RepID=UPI003D8166B9
MYIFFALLAVLLVICAGFVASSSVFAWYEQANRQPLLMTERFTLKRLWFALRFMALETACLCVTVLLHPLGWLRPWKRNVNREAVPVLLLHGLFHNRACWLWLRLRLMLLGVRSLHSINLPPWKDVESLTERVAKKVDELRLASGATKVHLVGHSMGGIIARNYLQIRGGAQKVDRCVLIASPNSGSRLAALALSPLATTLMPGSELLQRLAAAPIPASARVCAIYSRHDNIVLPPESAHLTGAENIELTGLGHTTLLYHPRILQTLFSVLAGKTP